MTPTIQAIAELPRSSLLVVWRDVIGEAPPKRLSTPLMRRMLAFEIQARRHGGLSGTVRKKLERLAVCEAAPRTPRLKHGARLLREWNGVSHVVDVTEDGYLWRGDRHRSLSAVARAITGAHWSGPRFFGLKSGGGGEAGR